MKWILWLSAWLVMSAQAAAPSDMVLEQLRAERQVAIYDPSRVDGSRPQIDLTPLVGASRRALTRSLGAPDFCSTPGACREAARVAYFFYPTRPLTARAAGNGNVEVTVSAGGGWALEIRFSHQLVTQAAWVKQT